MDITVDFTPYTPIYHVDNPKEGVKYTWITMGSINEEKYAKMKGYEYCTDAELQIPGGERLEDGRWVKKSYYNTKILMEAPAEVVQKKEEAIKAKQRPPRNYVRDTGDVTAEFSVKRRGGRPRKRIS